MSLARAACHEGGLACEVAGVEVIAEPEGVLFVPQERLLVAADLHFEKGSAFAMRGQMLPPYDTRATLARLAAVCARLDPRVIISLGDAFHDQDGPARMDLEDARALAALMAGRQWIWIEGNHDHASAAALGGETTESLAVGALQFRHEPSSAAAPGEIVGHLHPCARITSGGRSLRRRCFATDGARMVMPAFGAFTGGLNIRDPAFAAVFPRGALALVLGRDRVYAAGPRQQLAD